MKKWWKYLLNVDVLIIIFVIIGVIYCYYNRNNKNRFKLSDWKIDVEFDEDNDGESEPKKKKKKPRINKHEERCREIFEDIFDVQFKSVRPKWLENPVTHKNLELDGYNPTIRTPIGKGLAFEYDGKQHSQYNPHFHKHGKKEFVYQVKKDSWKDIRCQQEGVMLIRIPHFIQYDDLEQYIRKRLYTKGLGKYLERERTVFSGMYDH